MSRPKVGGKDRDSQLILEVKEITGCSKEEAATLVKKHKTLEGAIGAFYDGGCQGSKAGASSAKGNDKKLGDIWEKFKDPSNPKLIKIDGTIELCEELGIDPENDVVLFCLATDLGSKVTGEWEKGPWITGWQSISGNVDSIEGMKAQLPALRKKFYSNPAYFKKVYMHTFDLCKAPGARSLTLEPALGLWQLFITPALSSSPSALSHLPPGSDPNTPFSTPPQLTTDHFKQWIDFQTTKGKAVSKDTWNLLIDFIRRIDKDFKEYDEAAAWPSTIDDFVEFVRSQSA